MNKLVLCGVLSALVSTSASAEEFSGSRIGVGYSQTEMELIFLDQSLLSTDYGSGFKAEYGYDFNQIIGFNGSYEQNTGSFSDAAFSQDIPVDGESLKLSADIGYAFPLKSAFIKPYVKLGYQFYSDEQFSDNSLLYGLGLRVHYSSFYADASLEKFEVEEVGVVLDFTQTAFTVGYKF